MITMFIIYYRTPCAKYGCSGDTFWQGWLLLFLMMFHHKDMVWGNLSLLGDKWALWRALTALQCIVDKFSKKIQARGRAPPSLAMPAFWVHMVPQPLPYQANRQLLGITLRWWWMNERMCTLVHVLLTLSGDCSEAIIHPPYHTGRPQTAFLPGYNVVPLVSKVNPWFWPCSTTNTWSDIFI